MSGGWGLVAAVVLGLLINESSELSPWLAQKLVRWAARVRYPTRVEELSALIAERPGKLFKLVTASGFACAALTYRVTHRKTVPVRSVTSPFWIGFGSALTAGALLIGEVLVAFAIVNHVVGRDTVSLGSPDLSFLISMGALATFVTAAELLVPSRLPAGWATAVVSSALALTYSVVLSSWWGVDVGFLIAVGGMAVAAGVSAACAIRLGNRLRFPIMATSPTILGVSLLTFIFWTLMSKSVYDPRLVELLGFGFAVGFSAGVGVLLWRVLCGRWLSQSSPERVPPTSDVA